MSEKLAIIREAIVSREDHSRKICIVFSTYINEGVAASHWIGVDTPKEFESLWEAMSGDVRNLNGKPCWVNEEGSRIYFLRMAKI